MTDRKVLDLRPFVPAKDFELSRRFYAELGFRENWANQQVAELEIGGYRFLLQNYFVEAYAHNFMMQLVVEDADSWWQHVVDSGLANRYPLHTAKPPQMQPWGLRVSFVSDPSGVLWHIAERPKAPRGG